MFIIYVYSTKPYITRKIWSSHLTVVTSNIASFTFVPNIIPLNLAKPIFSFIYTRYYSTVMILLQAYVIIDASFQGGKGKRQFTTLISLRKSRCKSMIIMQEIKTNNCSNIRASDL